MCVQRLQLQSQSQLSWLLLGLMVLLSLLRLSLLSLTELRSPPTMLFCFLERTAPTTPIGRRRH